MSLPPDTAAAGNPRKPRSNLQLRIISAVVLAAVVFGLSWLGGPAFRLLAIVIGLAVYFEWQAMAGQGRSGAYRAFCWASMIACFVLILAGVAPGWMFGAVAFAVVAAALAGMFLGQGLGVAAGLAYAGFPAAALSLLRGDSPEGIVAVIFLFATVWATDIFAYFAGRRFGGPKLAPRISPNKTWSGAAGGAAAAIVAGIGVWLMSSASIAFLPILALSLFISVVAQLGDLFESGVKRHFGVKDSGQMIPGHGGMMDRVDGLVAGAVALYLIGLPAGGADRVAEAIFG